MLQYLAQCLGIILRFFCSRRTLLLENLTLRQQLVILKRRRPRPRLSSFDRLFWIVARCFWPRWKQSLIIVTPETVARWRRAGFRLYWRFISRGRKRAGRKQTPKVVRDLTFLMAIDNPTWGAPRIRGELLMPGFKVSERTVSCWMKRVPRIPDPAKRWLIFLRNHREAIAAMGFLHRSYSYVPRALLLLCHQPRLPTHSALQRHQASHKPMDCPAVAGGVSIWVGAEVSDLRPGRERRVGSVDSRSISENGTLADFL